MRLTNETVRTGLGQRPTNVGRYGTTHTDSYDAWNRLTAISPTSGGYERYSYMAISCQASWLAWLDREKGTSLMV